MGTESKTRKTHRAIEQIQTRDYGAPVKQAFNIFNIIFKKVLQDKDRGERERERLKDD